MRYVLPTKCLLDFYGTKKLIEMDSLQNDISETLGLKYGARVQFQATKTHVFCHPVAEISSWMRLLLFGMKCYEIAMLWFHMISYDMKCNEMTQHIIKILEVP